MDQKGNYLHTPICSCSAKKRVLVVDDDPQTSQDHAEDLRDWGYEPVVAEGRGTKLIEDAKAKARQNRCRVAIVDMRLFEAQGDESGLQLAGELAPTICVIVTAYGNIPATNRSRRYENIASFFEKGDDPKKLMGEVYNAFEKFCSCDMELVGPGYRELLRRAEREAQMNVPSASYLEDEIRCALHRLYQADDKETQIKQLFLNLPGNPYQSQTSHAIFTRSAVYEAEAIRADGYHLQREIIKVAEKARIEHEVQNYRKYVRDFLPPERSARIEDKGHQVTLWNIGAIRYTNIARNDRQLLGSWFANASSREVKDALRDLFKVTLWRWYHEGKGDKEAQNVYDYYVKQMFKPNFDELIRTYPNQNDFIDVRPYGIPLHLRNPVKWAYDHREDGSFISYWKALTHGDLHIGNILLDNKCQSYVLDYERSKPGYILRDFVELEADIRLKLTPIGPEHLRSLYVLDLDLLAPEGASVKPKSPPWNRVRGLDADASRKFHKAFDAICALRQLAHDLTGELDRMDKYYWALLMETLISVLRRYSHIQDTTIVNMAKTRALLSAALIAERLAAWNSDWPPKDWPRPEDLPEHTGPITPVEPDVE